MRTAFPLILLVFATAGGAQDVGRMREVADAYAVDGRFMGSVLVGKSGEVLFEHGYGSANLEWGIPNSPGTKYRLGSVTKQFTAAAILLLEERGKLKTDDRVGQHIPGSPEAWGNITLFHLLTHTSGVPNFTAFPEYRTWKRQPSSPAETFERMRDRPLDFPPGEKFRYSNSGYLLLGYIIERVSGQSYATFLLENIFRPLGMNDSGYDSNSAIIQHRAAGYAPGPTGPINAEHIDMTIPHAAGALYSTPRDLMRWSEGLFGGKLLSAESLEKMTTAHQGNYAFGLGVRTVGGRRAVAHGGGIEGFSSHLIYYPDEKVTVVALANLAGPAAARIAQQLAAVTFGEPVKMPAIHRAIELPVAKLKEYEGTYRLGPKVTSAIKLVGGQLTTQLTGQPAFPIFAEAEDKFFLKVVEARIEFTRDKEGRVSQLTLFQNGRTVVAPRVGSETAAVP